MAQIVTITNPLTGQPAQVDQLEHTAQQIDDGIARALPGGDIDIALQKKAPSGYGLGEDAASVGGLQAVNKSGLDALTVNGWCFYNDGNNLVGDTFAQGVVRTDTTGRSIYQTFYPYVGKLENIGCILRRCICDTISSIDVLKTWTPWEWVNPPMLLGVEYRTTERHLGRPVYVLTAEFGSNINGSIVYFGKDALRVVRGLALAGDGDSLYPWWSGNTVNNWTAFFDFATGVDPEDSVRKVKVTCWAQTGASASYGHNIVKVYYTKSTD